jgi:hypothetical protein
MQPKEASMASQKIPNNPIRDTVKMEDDFILSQKKQK